MYKDIRNRVKKLLRKAEIQYWREQFAEANNSKKFWQVVRKAQGKDKKRTIPPLYGNDGDILTDDLDKAKCINEYFTNIGKHLAEKFNHGSDSATDRQLEHIYRVSPTLSHINLSEKQVVQKLNNIKPKTGGPDNITSWELAEGGETLAVGLYSVFNNSILRNMYPENWKTGRVTPAYKKVKNRTKRTIDP